MTEGDKKRLAEIKRKHLGDEDAVPNECRFCWLISQLEEAWAENDRLRILNGSHGGLEEEKKV